MSKIFPPSLPLAVYLAFEVKVHNSRGPRLPSEYFTNRHDHGDQQLAETSAFKLTDTHVNGVLFFDLQTEQILQLPLSWFSAWDLSEFLQERP